MKKNRLELDETSVEVPLTVTIGIIKLLFIGFILCNARKKSKGLYP